MALDREEVLHLAALCRLGLGEEEVERLRHELGDILDHFRALQQVDVSRVPPTGHLGATESVTRADEVAASLPPEETLANAPRRDGGYFRVAGWGLE